MLSNIADLALILLGYAAVTVGLAMLAQPMRLRMVDLAEEILADEQFSERERDLINHLLDTAFSFRVGLQMPLAVLTTIANDVLRVPNELPATKRLMQDERYHGVLLRHFLSVLAGNPIVAPITIALMIISLIVDLATSSSNPRDAVEASVLRASVGAPA